MPVLLHMMTISSGAGAVIQPENFPVVESHQSTTTNATTLTITKPSGTVEGDFLFAFVAGVAGTSSWTPPEGWTLVAEDYTSCPVAVFRKFAGGSEGANYTFTSSNGGRHTGGILRISNVWTNGPINAVEKNPQLAAAAVVAPAVTTTRDNCLLLRMAAYTEQGTFPAWNSGTMTEVFNQFPGSTIAGSQSMLAQKNVAAQEDVGTDSSEHGGSENGIGITVAISAAV